MIKGALNHWAMLVLVPISVGGGLGSNFLLCPITIELE